MNKSRKLRGIAILIYIAGLFLGIVVLPLILGFEHPLMRNLAPRAPIAVTMGTILYTLGMVGCFLVYQYVVLSGRGSSGDILEVVACFVLYAISMATFATDLRVWVEIALWVLASMTVEYITLSLLTKQTH